MRLLTCVACLAVVVFSCLLLWQGACIPLLCRHACITVRHAPDFPCLQVQPTVSAMLSFADDHLSAKVRSMRHQACAELSPRAGNRSMWWCLLPSAWYMWLVVCMHTRAARCATLQTLPSPTPSHPPCHPRPAAPAARAHDPANPRLRLERNAGLGGAKRRVDGPQQRQVCWAAGDGEGAVSTAWVRCGSNGCFHEQGFRH